MALTHSTVVANDDVAVSTIIGADTGIVIQDSKPNKNPQTQKSEIDYELDINSDPVDLNCVIINDVIPASEVKIEAEIAVIETQHHRATIKRQLAEAQSDCDCGFPFSNAMTGPHAKAGNCQRDPTTIMTGALAIDKAIYF